MAEAETIKLLKQKLAACEAALTKERTKIQRLEAEALYMKTACARFIPASSVLHPSALASSNYNTMGTSHPEIVLEETETTVTISRTAYELLQLKDRAMDSIKEGITIADCSLPDMPLIYANQGFVRITGTQVADVLGKNCRFLQGDGTEEENVQKLRDAVAKGEACQVTLTNYRRNGDAFVNYLSITPVHNNAGLLTHYVGVQSDITELVEHKKAELAAKHQAVQAAAATEAKSQFLARMSHEIRTPLNGMIAVGQLLAEENLTPSQRDLVSTIRHSGETLLILISDILDFSRIEANKLVLALHKFLLRNVVETAVEIAGLSAAQKRLQVAYHIAENVPAIVMGDGQRLQQILLNVLNNAVKFTEVGEVLCEIWLEESKLGNLADTGYILDSATGDAEDLNVPRENACGTRHGRASELAAQQENARTEPGTPSNEEREKRRHHDSDSSRAESDTMPDSLTRPDPNLSGTNLIRPAQKGCSASQNGSVSSDQTQSSEPCTHTACGRRLACYPKKPTLINTIHCTVRDTGIGINKADLGRLFLQFSQVDPSKARNHGGSGLGLAICKRLVEAMGGKIWAESDGLGRGSCFHFTIKSPDQSKWPSHKTPCTSSEPSMNQSGQGSDQLPDPATIQGLKLPQNLPREKGPVGLDCLPVKHESQNEHHRNGPNMSEINGQISSKSTKPTSWEDITTLRQVLTDILPSGSDTASSISFPVSARQSLSAFRQSLDDSRDSLGNLGAQRQNLGQSGDQSTVLSDSQGSQNLPSHNTCTALLSKSPESKRNGAQVSAFEHQGENGSHRPRETQRLEENQSAAKYIQSSQDPELGLVGKRVLLIEPVKSVRQCLQLYLQRQGMLVEAVSSEDQAISCLKLQGALTRKGSVDRLEGLSQDENCLSLQHEKEIEQTHEEVRGPFDVVVSDVSGSNIRNALIQSAPSEAQRLVFMSWPGQKEMEDGQEIQKDPNLDQSLYDVPPTYLGGRSNTDPPKAQKEEMQHKMTIRQLAYVTVYRPIRQERLKQALSEVLRMPLDQSSKDAVILDSLKDSDGSSLPSESIAGSLGSLHGSFTRQQSLGRDFRESTRSSSTASLNSSPFSKHLRVLIAEDNIINLKVALGILQRTGVQDVICAADGIAALEEIYTRGGGDAFDIILTDLHMPRKGGLELVKDVRENWPRSSVKIVAVTADAFDDTRDMCLQAGFDGWLAKPFRIQDLTRVIDLVLTSKKSSII